MSTTTFRELNLSAEVLRALDDAGFENATPVQAQSIPIIFSGEDILAQSQTGTGKTIAFGIPAVQSIDPSVKNVQVLVLSPTRELSQQCGEEIRKLAKYMPAVKTADIFGGANYSQQFRDLRSANFVIGTPGRVMDHMKRGSLKLGNLKMIILDEADEMLNMGFKEDIEQILLDVPEQRQVVLFSATVSKGIRAITKQFLNNPVNVEINRDKVTLESISQHYVNTPKPYKAEVLKLLIHRYKPTRAIIFSNTKLMVDEITDALSTGGFSAAGLHGDMKQQQRSQVMGAFKRGKINILVATDVAARGIDVSDIDYVINYDIPKMSEYYVHRIGRTGRAGRDGNAITLCCGNNQIAEIRRLAHTVKSTISPMDIPTIADIRRSNREADLVLVREALAKEMDPENQEMVLALVEEGYDPVEISIALMSMSFSGGVADLEDVAPPKRDMGRRGERGLSHRGDNSSFSEIVISCGRSRRVAPNHIVGAITERTGITSKDIGKIIIEDEFCTVGIPTDIAPEIVRMMQGCKICGKPITAVLNSAPTAAKSSRFDKYESNRGKRHGYKKPDGDKRKNRQSRDGAPHTKRSAKKDKPEARTDGRKKR